MRPIFLHNWLPRVKPKINSVEVHPQLRNIGHPVDGLLVGAGSLWLEWGRLHFAGTEGTHWEHMGTD